MNDLYQGPLYLRVIAKGPRSLVTSGPHDLVVEQPQGQPASGVGSLQPSSETLPGEWQSFMDSSKTPEVLIRDAPSLEPFC